MADWFVYQRDLYPNDLDPDSLGIALLPVYDACKNVLYRDGTDVCNNGLRRVQSYWGVDPNIVQFDIFAQVQTSADTVMQSSRTGLPPLHTSTSSLQPSHTVHALHWFPAQHQFQFANTANGFRFENITVQQCLVITRDQQSQSRVTLMQKDTHGNYTVVIGNVMFIRMHKLTLLAPESLDTSTFSRYITAHINHTTHTKHTPDNTHTPHAPHTSAPMK